MEHGQNLTKTSSKPLSVPLDQQPGGASTRPMVLVLSLSWLGLMMLLILKAKTWLSHGLWFRMLLTINCCHKTPMEFILFCLLGKHFPKIVLWYSVIFAEFHWFINFCFNISDVSQPGFGTEFCGWHSFNGNIKYGWIGMPSQSVGCFPQYNSPNGDPYVDGALSTIAHEIIETATDPVFSGWYNTNGDENGDACAWNFVDTISTDTYNYNLVVGNMKYYIQANYNLGSQTCTMS
jgi:Phosphate-induced protein 1 conserved region